MNRWIEASILALCGSMLVATGCAKKEEAAPGATKASVSASAKASGEAPKDAAPASAKGAVLKVMPPDCKQGRVYLNAAAVNTIAEEFAKGAKEKIMATLKGDDAETAKKVFQLMKDNGIDEKSFNELAVCMNESPDDVVAAFGIDMSKVKGDPLDLIVKVLELDKEAKGKLEKKTEGKLTYLTSKDKDAALAVINGVLVFGKDLKALKLAEKGGGEKAWKNAKDTLLFGEGQGPEGPIHATVTDTGDNLKLVGSMDIKPKTKKGPEVTDEMIAKEMTNQVKQFAEEFEKTPFKDLAGPMKELKLTVKGNTVSVEATVPKKAIQSALKAAMDMKPEEIMQMMK